MPKRHKLELGSKFSRLTVVGEAVTVEGRPLYPVRCDCGKELRVRAVKLLSGSSKSCGCLKSERFKAFATRHGMRDHELYDVWLAMRQRCTNPNNASFRDYGARGITVDPAWESFEQFLLDMGERPEGFTLERRDNEGPYSKTNCVWATRKTQNRNTRKNLVIEFKGQRRCLSEWCELLELDYDKTHNRLESGMSVDKAFAA